VRRAGVRRSEKGRSEEERGGQGPKTEPERGGAMEGMKEFL
jgi:hypothetical protein